MKEEIWKDIEGFEGLYQVSNLGRVKSLDRYVNAKSNSKCFKKGKILKIRTNWDGYKGVTLCKKGRKYKFQLHRLIAQAFIPNPHNYPIINHKDENKSNNCIENIEWCTYSYNTNYGSAIKNRTEKQRYTNRNKKTVLQFTMDGEFIKEYISLHEAYRETGIHFVNISACCNNKPHVNSAGGYIWRYKEKSEA